MAHWKFVVARPADLTGKPVICFGVALALAACAMAPVKATAQAAGDVYKKMFDIYTHAKSFQGTIVRVQTGKTQDGKAATQTVTVKISFKAPNKYNIENTKSVAVSGKNQSTAQTMVTDGKSMYMYSAEKKLYQRGQVTTDNMLSRFFTLMNPANGYTLLPDTKVNGRTAFVLKPNLPTKGTPEQLANAKNVKISILIDKQTYQFIKMSIESPSGNLTQAVNGQVLNGSIPESAFVWNPPAGYKEVKAPASTGIAPVAPGRAPGQ